MPKKHPAPPGMRWGGHKAKSDTCVNELLNKILFLVGLLEKKEKEGWHLAPIAEQNKQDCASRHPSKERKTFLETFQAMRWTTNHKCPPDNHFTAQQVGKRSWSYTSFDIKSVQINPDKIYQNRGKELGLMGYTLYWLTSSEIIVSSRLSCRFARLVLMVEPLDSCDFQASLCFLGLELRGRGQAVCVLSSCLLDIVLRSEDKRQKSLSCDSWPSSVSSARSTSQEKHISRCEMTQLLFFFFQ